MSIDVIALATTVVSSFLVPYVKVGANKIAEIIAEKVGESAAKKAVEVTQSVWKKVQIAFSGDEEAVLQNFEKYEGAGQDLMIQILKKKLEEDSEFAHEINQIINPPLANSPESSSTGASIMKAHIAGIVDARKADFSNARNVNITGVSVSDAKTEDKKTDAK
ncbi:MAG: hypothetical protein SGI87_05545 [Flavobacteriales bacterium]|nr:hypothetical protein [Flavobacteriales bacterium]